MTRNARGADFAAFEEFVGRVEHRLRVALVASYGAHDGLLPVQQRTVVMLIHAFGWTQRDVADLLDINRSTVREHLDRAVTRLNHDLEVRGVR
jgi:DNA-directed RNA polymerase specialized sigma24 family protein